jgi:hypothetical protein
MLAAPVVGKKLLKMLSAVKKARKVKITARPIHENLSRCAGDG